MATSASASSSWAISSPGRTTTGCRSPRPWTIGCSSARIGATTRSSGADRLVGGVRVRQPPQDRQAPTDRVRARAQALVREGLPGREHGHAGGPGQAARGRREVLGLPGGGRDRQDEAVPGHPGGEEGDRGVGGDHRAVRTVGPGGAREGRVEEQPTQKSREIHESPHSPTPGGHRSSSRSAPPSRDLAGLPPAEDLQVGMGGPAGACGVSASWSSAPRPGRGGRSGPGPALGGIRLKGCSGPRATRPAASAQAWGAARSHSLRPPGCR